MSDIAVVDATQIYITLTSSDSSQYKIDISAGATGNQFCLGVYDPTGTLASGDTPGIVINGGTQISEIDISSQSVTFIPASGGINATVMLYLWATDASVKTSGIKFSFDSKLESNNTTQCVVQVSDDPRSGQTRTLQYDNQTTTVPWKST